MIMFVRVENPEMLKLITIIGNYKQNVRFPLVLTGNA